MNEVWRPVKGYEGLYEVSSIGNVRRIAGISEGKHKYPVKATTLKCSYRNGYPSVNLSKGGISRPEYVHRMVAMAFIPNPHNFPCVNHKDETRTNNRVENLEWCTKQYNNRYGTKPKRFSAIMRANAQCVQMFSKQGELIQEFDSLMSAHEATGIAVTTISGCIHERVNSRGYKQKTAGGYVWKHKDRSE